MSVHCKIIQDRGPKTVFPRWPPRPAGGPGLVQPSSIRVNASETKLEVRRVLQWHDSASGRRADRDPTRRAAGPGRPGSDSDGSDLELAVPVFFSGC